MPRQLIAGLSLCSLMLALCACAPAPPAPTAGPQQSTAVQAQQAVAGVGKEGQSLKGKQGVAKIVAGPMAALANVKQMAVLEIQVKQAIDVFKALEGRFPKSHEEFMEKCIEAYKIQLPELPAGAVYQFNTEKGELWVYPEDEAPQS